MNKNSQARLIEIIEKVASREAKKLSELKSTYNDMKRDDFLWHYLLQSFSTMGNSRGWYGLIGNKENYNELKLEVLQSIHGASERLEHIEDICAKAKIRMPKRKAAFIEGCYKKIVELGGLFSAKEALFSKEGRNAKIKFLKGFPGIGDKYARNIMMDVYHEDFRYSIAIDDRIKKILNSWNYEIRNYDEAEQFLLEIAERAKLNGWELDRLMYNFKDEFIVN